MGMHAAAMEQAGEPLMISCPAFRPSNIVKEMNVQAQQMHRTSAKTREMESTLVYVMERGGMFRVMARRAAPRLRNAC